MTWIELNAPPHTPAGSQFVLMSNYLNRILIKAPASLHLLLLLPEHVWVSAWFIPQFTNLKLNYRRRQLDCWVFVDLILFQLNSSPGSVFPRPGLWINSFEWNVLNYSCVRRAEAPGRSGLPAGKLSPLWQNKNILQEAFPLKIVCEGQEWWKSPFVPGLCVVPHQW